MRAHGWRPRPTTWSDRCAWTRTVAGAASLFVDVHPAAFPMRLHATVDGAVDAMAVTSAVGPGYHTYLARLVQRLGGAMDIAWATPDGGAGTTETTRFVAGGDRSTIEREMLLWLQATLKSIREARGRGEAGIQLSLPMRTRFTFDGAVATPLGPRDDAWLAAAIERPEVAIDVWPWWSDAVDCPIAPRSGAVPDVDRDPLAAARSRRGRRRWTRSSSSSAAPTCSIRRSTTPGRNGLS